MSEKRGNRSKFDSLRRLPVRIHNMKELEEKCPQFIDLLLKVSEMVDISGRSQTTQRRFQACKENTDTRRRKYLDANVRVETLNEVILKSELNSLTLPGASHETALVAKLKEHLTIAEVGCMLDQGDIEGEPVTTLGLDRQDLRLAPWAAAANGGMEARHFCRQLLPLVEDHMFSKLQTLLHLLEPEGDVENQQRRLLHPRIVRLPDRISDLQDSLSRDEAELEDLAREWEAVCGNQLDLVARLLEKLDSLVTGHYAGSKARVNSTTIKYMAAKAEALQLKLRLLELEILNSTYTKDSVAAIRRVRRRLEGRIVNLQEEVETLESRLVQYQAAGPEFNQVVLEYARLQKEIEGKKWAIDRLGRGRTGESGSNVPAAL